METTTHFVFHCPLIYSAGQSFLNSTKKKNESILEKLNELNTKTFPYGDNKFDLSCNKFIISSATELIILTGRLSKLLV